MIQFLNFFLQIDIFLSTNVINRCNMHDHLINKLIHFLVIKQLCLLFFFPLIIILK